MREFLATPEVRPEGVTVSRRRLLAGAGATAATAVAVAAPVGACPARYVGVPPVVVCMGDVWVNEWLAYNDDTREFIETICQGLAYLPTEERKDWSCPGKVESLLRQQGGSGGHHEHTQTAESYRRVQA